MKKFIYIIIFFSQFSFSQLKEEITKDVLRETTVVDSNDLKAMAINSLKKHTVIFTFGIWCTPCRLHLKNAINLRENFDVNFLILLIEPENDIMLERNLKYLYNIDKSLQVVVLKDEYGKKRNKKYKQFLKEITPEAFENLNGMSKYIVIDKLGEIKMITTWKDNRNNDWKDDSNMLKEKVVPFLVKN